MRSFTRRRRIAALSAAVGVLALTGPALPVAAAQGGAIGPPPLDPSVEPQHGSLSLQPGSFKQKQACMQGNPGGGVIEETPWSQKVLGFEKAHAEGLTGTGQKIAVIDSGVNQHQRFRQSIDTGGGSAVPGGASNFDCDGHGTMVAGIAAAGPDPSTGFVGVAYDSQIMSIRQQSTLFQDEQTGQTIGDTETMAQAIQYATDNDADVINISQSSCQPIAEAMTRGGNAELQKAVFNAYQKGTVVVVAAGNVSEQCQKNPSGNPTTAVLPAWFDKYVLTVASVNQQGAPAEHTVPGPWVDVAAPGENLISLDPGAGGDGLASQIATGEQGKMGPIMGTSFAAPYVSGLVALIKQKADQSGKTMTAEDIMERIEKTALHPGGQNGRNDLVGFGMIDPMAAISDVIPPEGKMGPRRLSADAIPQKNWPAIFTALGVTGGGIGLVIFTAFLSKAVRTVRARASGESEDDL